MLALSFSVDIDDCSCAANSSLTQFLAHTNIMGCSERIFILPDKLPRCLLVTCDMLIQYVKIWDSLWEHVIIGKILGDSFPKNLSFWL